MWICNRCQNENKEGLKDCQYCGAPRSAGRFAASQTGRFPRTDAPSPRVSHAPKYAQLIRLPSDDIPDPLPEMEPPFLPIAPPPPRRPVMGFARVIGVLLCILLPALAGLLAWRQYDVLSQALIPLLLDSDAAAWARIAVYAAFCLTAGMIALLPGLWTLMKIPPRPRRKKAQEEEQE